MGQLMAAHRDNSTVDNESPDTDQFTSDVDTLSTNCSNQYCISDEDYITMIRDYIWPDNFEWCIIAMYVVVFIVGVIGNGLVIYVVWSDRRMRTVTNLFIVNLSVADFFVVVVCLPPTVLGDVTETWFMGNVMCKIVLYIQGVSISVSVMSLTSISVERYYAICHPLQFKATLRRARLTIGAVWFVSTVIPLPDVIVLQTFPKFPPELQTDLLTSCKPAWEYLYQVVYQLFLILTLYLIPLILMAATYTSIAFCLWSTVIPSETVSATSAPTTTCRSTANQAPADDVKYQRVRDVHSQMISRRNVAKMLIAVVAMFGVCYLPVHLLNILRYAQVDIGDNLSTKFALFAHWLCYFNSSINPVIYNFMSEKFQKAFQTALTCRPCANQQGTEIQGTLRLTSAAAGRFRDSPMSHHNRPSAAVTRQTQPQKQQYRVPEIYVDSPPRQCRNKPHESTIDMEKA